MTTTVNGITAYELSNVGSVVEFIRQEGLTSKEDSYLATQETADQAGVAGNQSAIFSFSAGTDLTGLANDTTAYTATINVDGSDIAVSVTGSAAQTFDDLVTELNADLGANATAAISGNKITITSASTGDTSTVVITDVDLFSSVAGFVKFDMPAAGNLKGLLMRDVYAPTNQNAWDHFVGLAETYDPAAVDVVIANDLPAAGASYSQTETQAIVDKVNAIGQKLS